MQLAIFVANEVAEITALKDEMMSRGHEVTIWSLSTLKPEDFTTGTLRRDLECYDLIYYRSGLTTAGGYLLGEILGENKHKLVNPVIQSHPLCSNKLYQAILAQDLGMQIPPTYIGRNIPFDTVVTEFGLPFIVKAVEGIQGNGVFLVNNAEEYQELLKQISGDVVLQKFIANNGDYRVFMIGDKFYRVFRRVAKDGEFKNNIFFGAKGEAVEDPELLRKLQQIASKIMKRMNIEIGGVDVIESSADGELYFLEVNVNPGYKGLDAALGTNTTKDLADYLEARANSLTIRSL